MFKKKVETVGSIKEFMNRNVVSQGEVAVMEKGKVAGTALGLSMLPLAFAPLQATPVFAAESSVATFNEKIEVADKVTSALYDSMLHAFDPLITLIQGLAYPIAMVVVLGGSILVMIDQKERGYGMMMGAGLGYVLVQMTPLILRILADAMRVV